MESKYIIIQSGGKGTRLMPLTKNRPKSLVPVNNLPLIFHMFNKFPDKKYIIIGDYKYDVLSNYLETFASVDYILIHAKGEGNISGLDQALALIPNKEPFMIAWSDLLLGETFSLDSIENGCYIGITDQFTCSWRFKDGQLAKQTTSKNGVAGCFMFDSKERIPDVPPTGSFTEYLKGKERLMQSFPMGDLKEVGSLKALNSIDSKENRCRPYNKMIFENDKVIKTGLTKEAEQLIEREVKWYQEVNSYGFKGIPQVYSFKPLTMARIEGENIFKVPLLDSDKRKVVDSLYERLDELHHLRWDIFDVFDLQEDYYFKTLKRLRTIREVIPFSNDREIKINGRSCVNVFLSSQYLQDKVSKLLKPCEFGIIHGDCTLTNTLIDRNKKIYFIDARGYFGHTAISGDIYYDWAKVYYSIKGSFDQFNIKNFSLEVSEHEVKYSIAPSGWEHLTEYFLSKIPDCDVYRIKLIHAIIWLSLASHCWEDYDSLCTAFYNGLYLLNTLKD